MMKVLYAFAVVFLGAGVGGSLRHSVNLLTSPTGKALPVGTLAVNVLGGVAMGMLAGWFVESHTSQHLRLFLTTGVLGGFTTFSAFSLDAALMIERGKWGIALLYVTASVVLSIGGLFLGLALTRH